MLSPTLHDCKGQCSLLMLLRLGCYFAPENGSARFGCHMRIVYICMCMFIFTTCMYLMLYGPLSSLWMCVYGMPRSLQSTTQRQLAQIQIGPAVMGAVPGKVSPPVDNTRTCVCVPFITHAHTARRTIKDPSDGSGWQSASGSKRFGCKCPRPWGCLLLLGWCQWTQWHRYGRLQHNIGNRCRCCRKLFPFKWKNYAAGRQAGTGWKCAQLQHSTQKRAAHKKKCEMEKHIKRKTEWTKKQKTLSHTDRHAHAH